MFHAVFAGFDGCRILQKNDDDDGSSHVRKSASASISLLDISRSCDFIEAPQQPDLPLLAGQKFPMVLNMCVCVCVWVRLCDLNSYYLLIKETKASFRYNK